MVRARHRICFLWMLGVAALMAPALPGCDDDDHDRHEVCRFEPQRCDNGGPGAFCDDDRDCEGICCRDEGNCNGGMCTFACRDDRDCPSDMACEHEVCFYRCDRDEDCALGQSCEHGNTICEWP